MPAKIPKQCRVRGCTNLTTESHGYCSEHAGLAIGWRQTIKRKGTTVGLNGSGSDIELPTVDLIQGAYIRITAGQITEV